MTVIDRKICLLGDFAVGKTSLIRRFVENKFSDKYLTTVGVKVSRKMVQVASADSKAIDVRLLIWDLEGHTKFKGIAPAYLKGSKAGIIVGDLTRQETIDHVEDHIELFLDVNPKGILLVACNKSDLVSAEKRNRLMEMTQFPHQRQVLSTYATSAKTGDYVEEIFAHLARQLVIN